MSHRPPRRLSHWFAALLLLSLNAGAEQRPTVVFSCWVPPELPMYQQLNQLYDRAFDALGYDFEMRPRPSQRSLMEASTGQTDGECVRSPDLQSEIPDTPLLRIDSVLGQSSFMAWSLDPEADLQGPEALASKPYRIGYVRGNAGVTALIERLELSRTVPLTNTRLGLKMLSAGRLDLFVHTAASTEQALARIDLPQPVHAAGEIVQVDGYGYLHPDHKHLLEPLSRELDRLLSPPGLELE